MSIKDCYGEALRNISGGVELMFYQSSADDDATVTIDRSLKV